MFHFSSQAEAAPLGDLAPRHHLLHSLACCAHGGNNYKIILVRVGTKYAWVDTNNKSSRIQGGRSWQQFGEGKNDQKTFVKRVLTIFATNALFLRVIANLYI